MLLYNDQKYRKIQERARQANLAVRDLQERIRDARQRLQTSESHFVRTDSDQLSDDDRERLEKALRPIRADLRFYETELESAQREHGAIGPIARRLEDRLSELQREQRVEADDEVEPPKPVTRKKGEADLDKIREQITAAQARRDEVASAPLPAADAKARVDRYIDGIAASLDTPARLANEALAPDLALDLTAFNKAVVYDKVELTPVLLWAASESIREKLHALVDRQADPERALSADERERQLGEIDAELARLERDEEHLVCRIEAGGETIDRREDVNPDVVLELREVEDPAPRNNPPQPRPRSEHSREAERTTVIR